MALGSNKGEFKDMPTDKVVAYTRVTRQEIKTQSVSLISSDLLSSRVSSEVVEIRASGIWTEPCTAGGDQYPISLHLTAYPGCPVIPFNGDYVKVTIERDDRTPEEQIRGAAHRA